MKKNVAIFFYPLAYIWALKVPIPTDTTNIIQASTYFPKIWRDLKILRSQKGDMKQVPSWVTINTRYHCITFSFQATWCPNFCIPYKTDGKFMFSWYCYYLQRTQLVSQASLVPGS